jgi:hypothetical protein
MGRTLADFVRSNPTQILLVSELASDGGDRLGNRALIMLCVCVCVARPYAIDAWCGQVRFRHVERLPDELKLKQATRANRQVWLVKGVALQPFGHPSLTPTAC